MGKTGIPHKDRLSDEEKKIRRKEAARRHYLKTKESHKELRYKRTEDWAKRNSGYQKQYRDTHPEMEKNKALKYNYGITLEKYNTMFSDQGGCCKICGTHQSNLNRALCVDHCHKTNKVRALLCDLCNRGLGYFKDSEDLLITASQYLEGFK